MHKIVLIVALLVGITSAASAQQAQSQSPWWFYDWSRAVVVGPFDAKKDCDEVANWSRGYEKHVSVCWQGSGMAGVRR